VKSCSDGLGKEFFFISRGLARKAVAMSFRRTIVGAAIGAATGVVLHLALEIFGHIEAPWFAIIIGLLTGVGVRKYDTSSAGHVSYVRGAIAALIALCAIVGSTYLLGVALTEQASRANETPAIVAESAPTEDVASNDVEMQPNELEPDAVPPSRPAVGVGAGRSGRPGDFGVLQFTFIAVGTFIAYELGRGTGRVATPPQPSAKPQTPEGAVGN
jgi:hypothetical protein